MEQSTPAVAMPGMPAGATIIETSTQPQAPAAEGPPAFVSSTEGMSASQAAAMAFVDANRAAAVRDLGNAGPGSLNSRINAALAHALHDGPAPTWLKVENATADTGAPRIVPDGELPGMAAVYEPMQEAEAGHLRASAGIYGVPPADADALTNFCITAKIPATLADGIARRAAHHLQTRGCSEPMTAEEAADLHHETARVLGGQEKYEVLNAKARAYIESMGPEAVRFVDEKAGSLIFDPRILIALAGLADARGIKAN